MMSGLATFWTSAWTYIRQSITFILGIIVVLDAVLKSGSHVGEVFAGLLLMGIVPLDAFLSRLPFRSKPVNNRVRVDDPGEEVQVPGQL